MTKQDDSLLDALGQDEFESQEKVFNKDVEVMKERTSKLSSLGKSAVSTFETYAIEMKPGVVVDEKTAVRRQVGLYKAIVDTINKNDQDFNRTWSTLLKVFFDNRNGAFGEKYLYRYMHSITLTPEQSQSFRMLTDLMRQTAPLNGRKYVIDLLDFERILATGITPQGRQRIIGYYSQFR